MKKKFRKMLLLIAGLLVTVNAVAYDFEVDGIYYNITSYQERTVGVVSIAVGYKGNVIIPSEILLGSRACKVTSIGARAFSGCYGLTSVTIGNSVTSIGEGAFRDCTGLTSITIPNSVTSIGFYAFSDCTGLTSITIPNSVTSIEAYAFSDCTGLTSITIPNSVTSIGEGAFRDCTGLTSITIPNSVTYIGYHAFCGCSGLTSITIPNSVTSIETCTFSDCTGLTSVVVETGNSKYDSRDNCNAIIETSTNTLISGCKTTVIPNSVTSIGFYAFSDCTGLTSITIPNSVTSIGYHAFGGCSGLTSIYCKATTPPTASNLAFEDVVLVYGTLYIPNGSLNSYEAVDPWRNFFNIKETDQFPDGGVEGIEADEIKVVAKGGAIEVSGAEGEQVMVYNLSGQCVYSGMETSVSLEKGIYVVRVAGTVHKIIM